MLTDNNGDEVRVGGPPDVVPTKVPDMALMASAPDLLAALEIARDSLYEVLNDQGMIRPKEHHAYPIIEAALAKARGAS